MFNVFQGGLFIEQLLDNVQNETQPKNVFNILIHISRKRF